MDGSTFGNLKIWLEEKIQAVKNERMKNIASSLLQKLYKYPFRSGFAVLAVTMSFGPISLCLAFLLIANACFLSIVLILEIMVIATALSMLMPVVFFILLFAAIVASSTYIFYSIFFSGLRKIKSRKSKNKKTKSKDDSSGERMATKQTNTTNYKENKMHCADDDREISNGRNSQNRRKTDDKQLDIDDSKPTNNISDLIYHELNQIDTQTGEEKFEVLGAGHIYTTTDS